MKIFTIFAVLLISLQLCVASEAVVYRVEATSITPWEKRSSPPPNYTKTTTIEWKEVFWPDLGMAAAIPSKEGIGLAAKMKLEERAYLFATNEERYKHPFKQAPAKAGSLGSRITEAHYSISNLENLEAITTVLKGLAKENTKSKNHTSDPNDWGFGLALIASPITAEQVGTGQPAIHPESKSEGSDKPQPETEGRSR